MRPSRESLPDVLLPLEAGGEPRCWFPDGSLPLTVRISGRLADVAILAGEIEADLQSDDGAQLRWIAGDVASVRRAAEELLQRLAS